MNANYQSIIQMLRETVRKKLISKYAMDRDMIFFIKKKRKKSMIEVYLLNPKIIIIMCNPKTEGWNMTSSRQLIHTSLLLVTTIDL